MVDFMVDCGSFLPESPAHFSTELTMPIVKFTRENKEIEVLEGANLRQEALKAGINLYQGVNGWGAGLNKFLNCFGWGSCGTCRVRIAKGIENTNSMGWMEKAKFNVPIPDPVPCMAFIGNEETMRLACKTTIHGNVEVETGPELNLFGENFFS